MRAAPPSSPPPPGWWWRPPTATTTAATRPPTAWTATGTPGDANYVIVEHEGGWRTKYWHMMNGSVAVAVGDEVACGDTLGKVGSSGNSSQPHLHFQLEDAAGVVTDPYAGEYSQPETWWVDQGTYSQLPGSDCAAVDE